MVRSILNIQDTSFTTVGKDIQITDVSQNLLVGTLSNLDNNKLNVNGNIGSNGLTSSDKISLTTSPPGTTYPLSFSFYVANNVLVGGLDQFRLIAQGSASTGPTAPPYEKILMGVSTASTYPFLGTFDFFNGYVERIVKLNDFNANVLTVNNDNQQFLVKDTNKNFSSGNFLGVDSNSKITPIDILGGDNISKATSSGNITLNLDNVLTSITSINGYAFNLATNTTANQFLLKDTSVGGFSSGDLLNINSSGKIDNITPTTLLNTLTVSNGLVKGANTNTISISSTPTISITETMTLSGATNSLLKIKAVSDSFQPKLQYFQGDNLRVFQQYDHGNSKFDFAVKEAALHLKAYTDKNGGTGRITLDDAIVKLQAGDDDNPALDILTCSLTTINMKKKLCFTSSSNNDRFIVLQGNDITSDSRIIGYSNRIDLIGKETSTSNPAIRFISGSTTVFQMYSNKIRINKLFDINSQVLQFKANDGSHTIRYSSTNMDGLLIEGYGNTSLPFCRIESANQDQVVMDFYPDKMKMYKSLYMNQNTIYMTDNEFHYIKFNGSGMDGIEVGGYGSNGSLEVPVFRIKRTNGDTLFEAKQKCIEMYKPLYMNSSNASNRPIYLHTDENFFIKYKFVNATGNKINGTDLGGYGGNDGTDFASVRITATDANYAGTIAEYFPKNIKMYKHAGVILDNNTQFPLSENDAFTIRKDGLCNLLIRSFSDYSQVQLQASNNYNASIAYTGSQFRIETVNQEFKTVASHHNFFNGSSLRLAFQGDTNLVVYNGSTVKFASNDGKNAHSSRDYKNNINDLVESDSINIIKNINPVSFEYLEQYWDEHDRADSGNCDLRKGFIWEDMKPILPQATRTINSNNPDEPTTKTLDIRMVIPDLTKTVQYLLNKVETLTEQLSTQATLISNLQSQINS